MRRVVSGTELSGTASREHAHVLAGPCASECPGRELDFEQIVQLYRPRIFRYALAFLRDHDAAETITQDSFMRAYGSLASFRYDCSLQTWLMRIAINLVRDYARNRRLQFWKSREASVRPLDSYVARGEGGRSPEKSAMLKQAVEAIWIHAGKLPGRQKTVFLLRFVEDMDILEIAAATGMSEGTVKTHLFRALKRLRGVLEGKV